MNKHSSPPIPKVVQSSIIFDSFVKVREDLLNLNGNSYSYYTLMTKAPAVIILATTKDNEMIFIEEYRHPIGTTLLSCPGGYLDEGEEPLEAAKRELLEETGYAAQQFVLMGSAYPYAGISDQKLYYVWAQNAYKKAEPTPEPSESMSVLSVTDQQLHEWINAGKNVDGNLCTALFYHGRKI
jgi:ADP-ribose pyrophosphatase